MSKVYSIIFTNNTKLPRARPAIVIPRGSYISVAVGIPPEGRITKLTCKQTDGGTPLAYTLELLVSKIPYPPGTYAYPAVAADDVELYRVVPQQVQGAGATLELNANADGYAYANQDGTFTVPQYFLYLVIIPTPASSPTTTTTLAPGVQSTWDVAITAVRDVG